MAQRDPAVHVGPFHPREYVKICAGTEIAIDSAGDHQNPNLQIGKRFGDCLAHFITHPRLNALTGGRLNSIQATRATMRSRTNSKLRVMGILPFYTTCVRAKRARASDCETISRGGEPEALLI